MYVEYRFIYIYNMYVEHRYIYFILNQITCIKTVEYCRAHFTTPHIIIIVCILLETQLADSNLVFVP